MFSSFKNKMLQKGVNKLAIQIFEKNFQNMTTGQSFVYESKDIEPLIQTDTVLEKASIKPEELITKANKVALIKLNGGLGTSMGLQGPKSQLVVKNGLNFLEITVKQIQNFNQKFQTNVPLIFMNSFNTNEVTEANLQRLKFDNLKLPHSFNENKSPKIKKVEKSGEIEYKPASYPNDESLEWAPPGHADVYPSLYQSGMLDELLSQGYEYLFISNIDNLGAVLTPEIIDNIFHLDSPFIMEVALRTENDKKGGHLALKNGRLILRESSQVLKEDENDFQDFNKYKFFNTNSIWIKIKELKELLDENQGILDLPIIINEKNINPSDLTSEKIIQLESAMGSAISLFQNAKTILVPSERFIPVKNTANLLFLLSDLVQMDLEYYLHPVKNIVIDLKNPNYKMLDNFNVRFKTIPSLVKCESLTINNDVYFDEFKILSGKVIL